MSHNTFLIPLVLVLFSCFMFMACQGNAKKRSENAEEDIHEEISMDSVPDETENNPDFHFPIENTEVNWFPCSFHEGEDDNEGECAAVEVPLDWRNDDGQVFTTYVKRRLAEGESEGQLWFLHGGPGGSGVIGLPKLLEGVQQDYPELDVYTLDARGTGYSDYLECPRQESDLSAGGTQITLGELGSCIAHLDEHWGDTLSTYNTTNSSIDLGAIIHATREPGKKVLIWGGSGGTFWAQRYLQMFPEQADGIILEGIVPPTSTLSNQDEYDEIIIEEILSQCFEDQFCSQKLPDPRGTFIELINKLDDGHCPSFGPGSTTLKILLTRFAYYSPFHATIPAIIYRIDRCETDDVYAIYNMYLLLFGNGAPKSMSTVLNFHQICSEMWLSPDLPTIDTVREYLDLVMENAIFASGKGYLMNDIFVRWPKYEDPLDDLWAQSDVPMLMLQGLLDPSTPHDYAIQVGEHYSGEYQHFLTFPYSTHNVSSGSPTVRDYESPRHCGKEIFVNFLRNPTGHLDTSCMENLLPIDFEGTTYAPRIMETPDYWENGGQKSGEPKKPPRFDLMVPFNPDPFYHSNL